MYKYINNLLPRGFFLIFFFLTAIHDINNNNNNGHLYCAGIRQV